MVADLDIYRTAKVLIYEFEEMAGVGATSGRTWRSTAVPQFVPTRSLQKRKAPTAIASRGLPIR